ncbi:hypothetical protein [Actinoallomurus acaciae]|uniref:Uncharacterized protein n=1 Tax=Actinoallomurus acaciae TaxID=502577 RepID=A0ABV5YQW0_9ACTN
MAFAVGTVVAPVAAYAATGSFSSGSSTSAVTATNTGGGYALNANSSDGTSILSASGGTGSGSAMLLRQNASDDGSNALYAKTYTHTGTHYGVQSVTTSQGADVFGQGTAYGVVWVGDAAATGFTLNLAPPAPGAVDFGYHVVGLYTPAAARAKLPSSAAARPSRARR